MVKYGLLKRAEAVSLFEAGFSCSEVAKRVGVPPATAKKWSKALKDNPRLFLKGPRHHRKGNLKANRIQPPLDKRDKTTMVAYVKLHGRGKKRRGMRRLAAELSRDPHNFEVSHETLRKVCKDAGMRAKHPARKPVYTAKQRKKRVSRATVLIDQDWSHTLATDELDLTLDGSINGHNDFEWLFEGEETSTQPRRKFPSARHYFVGISAQGALEPVEYTGTLTAERYQQLLDNALAGANALFGGHEWRLLHDGAPYHTADSTQEYLETAVPSFITKAEWPVAPDGNPAESIFGEIQHEVASAAPRNLAELDTVFRAAYRNATTPEKLSHLFSAESMRRRFQAIIDAKGHHTHY